MQAYADKKGLVMVEDKVLEEVSNIVRETLAERFDDDEVVFGPIVAIPKFDEYDEEYVQIYIGYEGDAKPLDPAWTVGLVGRIWPRLIELGVPGVPGKFFIPQTEWNEVFRKGHKYHGAF